MAFKSIPVVAAKVSGSHTNFPVLVTPSAITGLGSITLVEAQSSRFYSDEAKTTELAREVVSADEIHVKVPSLTTTTTIYIDYDGVRADYGVADTYGRNNVWDSLDGVYHLGESTGVFTDSAGNLDLSTTGNVPDPRTAVVGDGQDFDGTGDYGSATIPAIGSADFHFEWWFKCETHKDFGTILSNINGSYYGIYVNQFPHSTGDFQIRFYHKSGTSRYTGPLNFSTWYKLSYKRVSGSTTVYLNKTLLGSGDSFSDNLSITTLYLGKSHNRTDRDFIGQLDEFRMKVGGTFSDDYVTTMYNNQNDNGGFWGTATDAAGGPTPTTNNALSFGGGI